MASDGMNIGLHEPVAPPRYPISSTSQGGYAFIAATLATLIAGLAVFVKLHMAAVTFQKMRRDDYALTGALIFAIAYTIATCRSVDNGLGRDATDLADSQTQRLSQFYLAANVLLYPSLACSKAAISLLVIAIQPARWMAISLYTVCGISAAWGVAAMIVTAVQCGPDRWVMGPTADDTCIDQYGAQIGLRLVDIFTDVAIAVLPGVMMMGVQVPAPKKAAVAFMFALRLITPVFTAMALAAQADFFDAPTRDRPFQAVTPSVWNSIAMGLSLITACLPSIKRFLMDWAAGVSNNMVGDTSENVHTSSGGKTRQAQASGLRSFTRSRITGNKSQHAQESAMYSSFAHGGSQERDVINDDGDSRKGLTEGIMQTTDVRVQYEEEQQAQQRHRKNPSLDFRMR